MVRTVKEEEYAQRRNTILDTVARLLARKGYEQMTLQDILEEQHISKGAFYHYFDSKQAAFAALLERMGRELEQHLLPIVEDSGLRTVEKLQHFFDALAGWKATSKEVLFAVTRTWYGDENALVRDHVRQDRLRQVSPLLTRILEQGDREGVLTVEFPEQVGELVVALLLDLNDALAQVLLARQEVSPTRLRVERLVAAYTLTLTRALDLPPASLRLVDTTLLVHWLTEPAEEK